MVQPSQPGGPGSAGPESARETSVLPGAGRTAPKAAGAAPSGSASDTEGTAAQSTAAAKKATQIGDFVLKKKLGQGGMGTVYLAHQISLDRDCAVKVMAKELAAKPGFVDRFLREARAMARIDHPNVVSCYAVGEEKGHHYVAMELVEGQSLQDWLDQLGKLSVADAVLVTLVAAEALEYAHSLKMIHRDIKPDNLLVTHKGIIKVADLGLAKATDEDMSMTASGTGLGTPHYMPPEQARNAKHVDHRCDIYALGCTLYHMVTGQLPFAGETIIELITNKEQGKFKPARRINAEVPERLDLMIDKAMQKDPAHRYQSMREFIVDLESLGLAGESLSFISHPQKVAVRRGTAAPSAATAPAATTRTSRPVSAPTVPSSASDAAATSNAAAEAQKVWYVRAPDEASGRIKMAKLTTAQVLAAIKTDKFSPRAQIAPHADGPYLPAAQIPVFEGELKRMLTRVKVATRDQGLAAEYEKLARQYDRQKWWRLFARFKEGTLGLVGLILYLAAIGALIATLVWAVPYLAEWVAAQFHLKSS